VHLSNANLFPLAILVGGVFGSIHGLSVMAFCFGHD